VKFGTKDITRLMRKYGVGICVSALTVLFFLFLSTDYAYSQPSGFNNFTIIAIAKNFPGLDPTGAADSTNALQAALNEAGGKRLILPGGTYTVTSLAMPKNGVNIFATGAKLVLGGNAIDGTPILSIPKYSKNIQIDGLEIDGRSNVLTQFTKISSIVSSGHVTDVLLNNIYFHDIPLSAVELSSGDANWEIANNRIVHTGRHGIAVDYITEQAHDLYFHDNHIEDCALSPMTIIAGNGDGGASDPGAQASAGVENVNISKNYVSHNGLDINGYSPNNKDIVITENTIEDNGIINQMGHAIHFAGTNIIITKNIAHNTAITAIEISGWPNGNPTPSVGFDISDNVVENVLSNQNPRWGEGILVQNASDGKISGNQVSGTKQCPIEVDGNALDAGGPQIRDVTITGNAITNSPKLGNDGICVSHAVMVLIKDNNFIP